MSICLAACTLPDVKVSTEGRKRDAGVGDVSREMRTIVGFDVVPDATGSVAAMDAATVTPSKKIDSDRAADSGKERAAERDEDAGTQDASRPDATAGKRWHAPELVAPVPTAQHVTVALDRQGNRNFLWSQTGTDALDTTMWAKHLAAGGGESEPLNLSTDPPGYGVSVGVGADGQGNATFAFLAGNTAPLPDLTLRSLVKSLSGDVYVRRYEPSSGWGPSVKLGRRSAAMSDLVVTSRGDALLAASALTDNDSNIGWDLTASLYQAGKGWSGVATIKTVTVAKDAAAEERLGAEDFPMSVAVALNQEAASIILWQTRSNAVYAEDRSSYLFDVAAVQSAPRELDGIAGSFDTNGDPQVAWDDAGHAVAVWSHNDGKRFSLRSSRYIDGTGWGDVVTLDPDAQGDVQIPRLIVHSQGDALVVWTAADAMTTSLWYIRYAAGSGWGKPARVEPDAVASNAQRPWLASDGADNVIAIWDDASKLRASFYAVNRGWSTPQILNAEGSIPDGARVTMSAKGDAIVTWEQDEGGSSKTWMSRFE